MRIGYPTLVLNIAGFVLPYSGGTAPAFTGFSPLPYGNGLFGAQKLFAPNLTTEKKIVNDFKSNKLCSYPKRLLWMKDSFKIFITKTIKRFVILAVFLSYE